MRPAVVTAVLLLVACVPDAVTIRGGDDAARWLCDTYHPDQPCGDGWSRIDKNRCIKYFKSPKTFNDAQEYCRALNGDLVSLHGLVQAMNLLCLTFRSDTERQPFWIGAKRSGEQFLYTDGTEFKDYEWYYGQPDNASGDEDCVESNYEDWGYWNDATCSEEKNFVCAKNM